jgi:hypothetical protein
MLGRGRARVQDESAGSSLNALPPDSGFSARKCPHVDRARMEREVRPKAPKEAGTPGQRCSFGLAFLSEHMFRMLQSPVRQS